MLLDQLPSRDLGTRPSRDNLQVSRGAAVRSGESPLTLLARLWAGISTQVLSWAGSEETPEPQWLWRTREDYGNKAHVGCTSPYHTCRSAAAKHAHRHGHRNRSAIRCALSHACVQVWVHALDAPCARRTACCCDIARACTSVCGQLYIAHVRDTHDAVSVRSKARAIAIHNATHCGNRCWHTASQDPGGSNARVRACARTRTRTVQARTHRACRSGSSAHARAHTHICTQTRHKRARASALKRRHGTHTAHACTHPQCHTHVYGGDKLRGARAITTYNDADALQCSRSEP